MDWHALIYIAIGVLLGYGLFLGHSAQRSSRRAEDQAMRLYAASLRRLAARISQCAQMSAEHQKQEGESELKIEYRKGMTEGQKIVADELLNMANKVE